MRPFVFAVLFSVVLPASTRVVNEYVDDPVSAAQALLERVVPTELQGSFQLELVPRTSDGADVMALSSNATAGLVILRGSGGVELASALNWYMNDYLNVTYDWATYAEGAWHGAGRFAAASAAAGAGEKLPLPPATGVAARPRQLSQSYYMNVCTPGYSLAWSDWQYWQKHVDWMALNGINLPLSLMGTEFVWNELWTEMNFTSDDLAPFFSGPAFLPWYRMGNMRGWGGPLTAQWMVSQRDLQLKVLARQRGLGMRPVLGAFAGFVPAAFAKRYPNASLKRAPAWAGFEGQYGQVYQLEATDPLFGKIGKRFIELQTDTYGTDHIYSCDTFNEMDPPSGDLAALKASSAAVYGAMAAADSSAVWLMQGWLFIHQFWTQHPDRVEAYLSGAPTPTRAAPAGMWVLDLYGTSKPVWSQAFAKAYHGKPFILCTLLNFGGQQGMFGNMAAVESGVNAMIAANANGTANGIGVGITMEGIWTNYGVFERALALSWAPPAENEDATRFATRRYGGAADGAIEAWEQSLWPLYHGGPGASGPGSQISSLPKLPPQQIPIPAGFKPYSKHGYWSQHRGDALPTFDVCPLAACAAHCAANASCKAFEVYLENQDPLANSNCYLFDDITIAWNDLAECQTYIKVEAAETTAEQVAWPEPRSMMEHYALSSRHPDVPLARQHPTARVYAALLDEVSPHRGEAGVGGGNAVLAAAWTSLLRAAPQLGQVALFRFDLVDAAMGVIQSNFSATLDSYKAAFAQDDRASAAALARSLLATIDDYDTLLSSNEHFMLGRWIRWARGSVPNASMAAQSNLEFNARNQITLWGPRGEINDYAKKEWGGLVRSYYKPRYELWFDMADKALASGATDTAAVQKAYEAAALQRIGQPWSNDTTAFPASPEHDLLIIASSLHAKYVLQQ